MAFTFLKLDQSLLADREKCRQYINATLEANVPRIVTKDTPFKFTCQHEPGVHILPMALKGVLPQPKLASKETVAKEMSLFSEDMVKDFEKKKKCYLTSIIAVKEPIFQPGEHLITQWFTYLEKPFETIAQGTAVFVRETNLSTHCFFIIGHIVTTWESRQQLVLLAFPPPMIGTATDIEIDVGDIAASLGKSLLGSIAGKVGALIFNEIFPPGVPSYFNEVYKKIQKIVDEELTQSIIHDINGEINGLQHWVKNTYTPHKTDHYSKKALTDLLTPQVNDLAIKVLGVLQDSKYANAGICTFMIGAGMHLALLQELSYEDPDRSSPQDSAYVETIKKYAKEYVDFARKTTNNIIDTRLDMIKPRDVYAPQRLQSFYENTFTWEDHFTDESKSWTYFVDSKGTHGDTNAKSDRDKSMAKHKEKVKNDLIKKMSDPFSVADDWHKLVDQPLPK